MNEPMPSSQVDDSESWWRPVGAAGDIEHDFLAGLYEAWDAARGGEPMPTRGDLDVLKLKPWLGMISLIDIEQPGPRYRYRIFATRVAQVLGRDLTGSYVDADTYPALSGPLVAVLREVVAERAPVLEKSTVAGIAGGIPFLRLAMPLSDGGEAVGMTLIGLGGAGGDSGGAAGFTPDQIARMEMRFAAVLADG
jgi:hypothetical protein